MMMMKSNALVILLWLAAQKSCTHMFIPKEQLPEFKLVSRDMNSQFKKKKGFQLICDSVRWWRETDGETKQLIVSTHVRDLHGD